jgi:hypothetical protein
MVGIGVQQGQVYGALHIVEAPTMRQDVALGLGVTLWRSIVND